MGKVKALGIVKEVQKGGIYRCYLDNNKTHEFLAHLSGRMRKRRIAICAGDSVQVELSPYDLKRGRIIWRH